ncbi:hypothetical protein [Rahnella victoriana]|uniref:hypothetical protein n=1 Tax=Rahnella victoriana TaxID=1510570 RepID=UPI000F512CF3|nr:hypothetical protein [Rahnella victoriana]
MQQNGDRDSTMHRHQWVHHCSDSMANTGHFGAEYASGIPANAFSALPASQGAGADQIGDKGHDFCKLCVHSDMIAIASLNDELFQLYKKWHNLDSLFIKTRNSNVNTKSG